MEHLQTIIMCWPTQLVILKEIFFGVPVDQVGLAYSNGFDPSA
jgi:hypothetical protein